MSVIVSVALFAFILGILITVHEWGHFIAARKMRVGVERFSLGFGRVLWKKKKGETEYTLSAVPLGGYIKMAGETREECKGKPTEYFSKPSWRRAVIVSAGPLLNYCLGFVLFWFIFVVGYPALTTKVGGLIPGYGAQKAGVLAGDRIIAIDTVPVHSFEDLQRIVHEKKEASVVQIAVQRNGAQLRFHVAIKENTGQDLVGRKQKIGLLGITPSDEYVTQRYGVFKALLLAGQKTWDVTTLTYQGLWNIVTMKLSMRESVTGPLGMYVITSKIAGLGILPLLHLVALLSIGLALFNILPIPVLDGGHLLFLGLEKIRGKALSVKTERVIANIGLTFLLCIMLVATYNDVLNFDIAHKITHLFGH